MNRMDFETKLCNYLDEYLLERKMIDFHKPECADVIDKFPQLLNSFISDAVKEFNNFPLATLAWMAYIGMAISKFWDTEWDIYDKVDDLYLYLRNKRGYDQLDDYISEEVLCLNENEIISYRNLTMSMASGVYDILSHSGVEPGTRDAFILLIACFKQMFYHGVYIELYRLGYHMTQVL